jgi:pimeloyl-ACP methyl ester carboxylesterase
MDSLNIFQQAVWINEAVEYGLDAVQRSILFTDILRRRGNNYFESVEKGLPPVLVFNYEVILDGRTFDRPANYALSRIIPREGDRVDKKKRPIVVIDPRAGNGPGIGGSKQDSEIGDALAQGHPVYFILFYPDPMPGQTLADVEAAEIRFIEHVAERHPNSPKPAVIGNCQAGWAVALLAADRPDLTGPIVLNGAPLSYWSGVHGKNPMRYAGGLLGGVWTASLLSDLGNGKFDGAWLEANFENLNPANTLWTKQYNLWAKVDTEEERFLSFEKWWNGFSFMTKEELHTIVENLFVGDRLEQGEMSLRDKKKIQLKDIEAPILLFASEGDNITPPQQAFDWIMKTYGSVEEIKRLKKVIVGLLHPHIGHLGIFVGGKIAKKEHKEIIRSIDAVESLPPGLYEMIIDAGDAKQGFTDYDVRFEERDFKAIMALNDDVNTIREEEADFRYVAAISEMNDTLYHIFVSPWVRLWTTEFSAEVLRQAHPLRMRTYFFSDRNPLLWPFKTLASVVKEGRSPVSPDNLFLAMERSVSASIEAMLDLYKDVRDNAEELMFNLFYGNPWLSLLLPKTGKGEGREDLREEEKREAELVRADREHWLALMEKGGFIEGVLRMVMALAEIDHAIDRDRLFEDERILEASKRMKGMSESDFVKVVQEQSRILQIDEDRAIKALSGLIQSREERREALKIARQIMLAERDPSDREKSILEKIEDALELQSSRGS